jgi:MtrB/PioB family decaheme-associated outer membrane protein
MNRKQIALCAALAGLSSIACAQEATGFISLGAGYWSDDRPQWGMYDGMHQEGGYLLLDGKYSRRDDATGTWLKLDASSLGLNNRELRAEWLRQGDMGAFIEYSRTEREHPYTILTGVTGIGTSVQRVPAVANPALGELHLGMVRDRTGVGASKRLGGGYALRVTFNSEEKNGARHWGRGGQPEFVTEPIDWTTRQLEAVLAYSGARFQWQGGYYGSWFTNQNGFVDTARTDGSAPVSLSLPLDNEAHQFFLNGGYNFTAATRATFKASYTRATQNEVIPVGPGVLVFAGAPTSLNGRLDNTLLQGGVTSRLGSAFSWLANLRYYKSDEKTPQQRIIQTNPACATATQCVDNTPLTFETITGKLEGTYRMMQGLALTAGLEHSKQDRTVPQGTITAAGDIQRWVPWRTEIDETTYRLQLRRSLSETLNGSIAYLHSKRDGSDFTPAQADPTTANLINPIYIADRDRDKLRGMVDWTPIAALTLTLNAEYAKDDYGYTDARPYGVRDGEATLFSLDASYAISERWQANVWYARDNTQATQVNQRLPDVKTANLEDTGDNFGAGLSGQLLAALKTGFEVLYSKNVNKYPETVAPSGTFAAGTVGPLPDITNKLIRFKLYAVYALQKNADVRVDYIHERWRTDDWTWFFADNSTPFTYGATTDGTTVIHDRRQDADFIGVRYQYRF